MRSDYTDKKGEKEYRAMEDKKRTYFKRMFNSIFTIRESYTLAAYFLWFLMLLCHLGHRVSICVCIHVSLLFSCIPTFLLILSDFTPFLIQLIQHAPSLWPFFFFFLPISLIFLLLFLWHLPREHSIMEKKNLFHFFTTREY